MIVALKQFSINAMTSSILDGGRLRTMLLLRREIRFAVLLLLSCLATMTVTTSATSCKEPRKPPIWDWHYYSNQTLIPTSASTTPRHHANYRPIKNRKNVLIAQYMPHSHPKHMMWTLYLTQFYAKRWNADYVSVQGITLAVEQIDGVNCEPVDPIIDNNLDPKRTGFNKIALLQAGLDHENNYDQIVVLDEAAFIYNMEFDITTILPDTHMLAAHRVFSTDAVETWDISNGVTIWNVHHPMTKQTIDSWAELSPRELRNNNTDGDQAFLQSLLRFRQQYVYSTTEEFNYGAGTVFKRYTRDDCPMGKIDVAVSEICLSYPELNCEQTLCPHRPRLRRPTWDWRYYSNDNNNKNAAVEKNSTTTSTSTTTNNHKSSSSSSSSSLPSVLVAQYSGFGKYAEVLEWTAPINKVYAKLHGYDYVAVQGSTMLVPRDYWCPPKEERSRFNKIQILQYALSQRDKYEYLLMLDADAMVYDLSTPAHEYIVDKHQIMLAAQRVKRNDKPRGTWNINNGITLWNLHHFMTNQVADEWYLLARELLQKNPSRFVYNVRGDQAMLHIVIESRSHFVHSHAVEFLYENATSIKHFKRNNLNFEKDHVWNATSTNLDQRVFEIQNATKHACAIHAPACNDMEHTVYTE